MEPYNGYSGSERAKKYQEYKRLRDQGKSVPDVPPCQLCGNPDPDLKVEPHSEDYSLPYLWTPPAEYMVCKSCHLWVHKRFNRPETWEHFKEHVGRGGYAVEFSTGKVMAEREAASAAKEKGLPYIWKPIPGRAARKEKGWWEDLTLDKASRTAAWARPRP